MPPFDLAIALRVVGTGPNVTESEDSHEDFEVLGDKLRAVVADESGDRLGGRVRESPGGRVRGQAIAVVNKVYNWPLGLATGDKDWTSIKSRRA